jgi:hypothetical protein
MRRLLLLGLVLVVACSDDDDGTDPNDIVDIDGDWIFSASASNPELDVSCVLAGSLSIQQNESQFTGTITESEGTCTTPEGDFIFDSDGAIGGGAIVNEDEVQFDDPFCTYSGQAQGNPADQIEGEVACVFSIDGVDVPMEGTWQMDR